MKPRRPFITRYGISVGVGLGSGLLYTVSGLLGAAMPPVCRVCKREAESEREWDSVDKRLCVECAGKENRWAG